ncbi:MAG: cell division protein FtsZ [Clostridiales bacterium]|nr:cell division protein FtsZ [Clostridiales bacterium]
MSLYDKGNDGSADFSFGGYAEGENPANILVAGVGGAGGNAVNRMIESGVGGVEYVAINTDAMALQQNKAPTKIAIGKKVTRGLGAGGRPAVGYDAAKENKDEIAQVLEGADMVFITAGMGGGTGTGAAPLIADIAKSSGALTVGVVTKPFAFEGKKRARFAVEGINSIKDIVDTLIVIPNENLLGVSDKNTTLNDAFKMADEVLMQGVFGISDLISNTGVINVDFADVKTIMSDKGIAHMGIGRADSVSAAMLEAINSPLLETSISGAKYVLVNIAGDENLSLYEVNQAMIPVEEVVDPNAEIIFGTSVNNDLNGEVIVTLVVTGLNPQNQTAASATQTAQPQQQRYESAPQQQPVSRQTPSYTPTPEPVREENEYTQPDSGRFKNSEINIPAFLRQRR